MDLVTSFCDQYPLCPTLVTSRLVGYDDAKLTDDFEELVLEKFDTAEIENYTTKFFQIVGGRDAKEATKLSKKFVNQTSSNAADLRANPLMLGLMAWLFNARGDVPTNRPEIYSECAVLMFERWDPDRGIKPDIPVHFDKLQLFTALASKIFGNPQLSAGVERSWLDREINSYLASLYDTPKRAVSGAQALVHFITGRAWVMTDVGDGVYAFTHQTFLEYFFARFINESTDTVREVLDAVTPKILNREWDVVSHLSLQMKTHRSLRRENEAIDELTKLLVSPNGQETSAVAMFCARSLEYLVGSEANVRTLASAIFDYVMRYAEREDSATILLTCLQGGAERREFVIERMFERIVESFTAGNNCEFIASLLSYSSSRQQHLQSGQLPEALSDRIVNALKGFVADRAQQNAQMARFAWAWYGLLNKPLLNRFGLLNYYDARIRNGMNYLDGLSSISLAASEGYSIHYRRSPFSKKKARETLTLIGTNGASALLNLHSIQPRSSGGPPLNVWKRIFRDLSEDNNALAGAFLNFLVVTELDPESFHGGDRDRTTEMADRKKLIDSIFSQSALRQLPAFGQMEKAFRQVDQASVKGSEMMHATPAIDGSVQ